MKSKIVSFRNLPPLVKRLRKQKKRLVFTNGTFDLLHLGHITYLQKAKKMGDVLIVGVNSDRSVKTYKDPDRPIHPQNDRMKVLAALECIDYVVLFEEPTPIRLILAVKPDILVKGSDWKKGQIAGAKEVGSWDGKVKRVSLVPGRSTTRIIQRIQGGAHGQKKN